MRSACATSAARASGVELLDRGRALVERRHERILRRRRLHEAAHLIDRQVQNEARRNQILLGALARFDDSLGHARADLSETRDVVRRILRGAEGMLPP